MRRRRLEDRYREKLREEFKEMDLDQDGYLKHEELDIFLKDKVSQTKFKFNLAANFGI